MDVLACDSRHQHSLQLLATSLVAQDHHRISSSQIATIPVSHPVSHYQRILSPTSPCIQQASNYQRILSSSQLSANSPVSQQVGNHQRSLSSSQPPATSIEDESFFEVDVADDDLSDCDEDNKNDDGANEDYYRGDDAYDEQDATFVDSTASNYLAPQQRFKWTTKEINFVGQWCKKTIKETKNKVNIVARCYSYICANEDVKKIFHPHHIARGDRLYYAFKTYNKSN